MKFYPNLKENMPRVVVADPGDHILPELGVSLGRYAQERLARRGVEVRLKTKVAGYDGKEVALDDGTKIATRMLIWTAGTTPPPLLSTLPCAKQRGRIVANDCLQVPDWPGVWALGDCALVPDPLNPGQVLSTHRAARHPPGRGALASNIVAAMRGQVPAAVQVQNHRPAGNHRTAPRRRRNFWLAVLRVPRVVAVAHHLPG